jgi:hypothetical protein
MPKFSEFLRAVRSIQGNADFPPTMQIERAPEFVRFVSRCLQRDLTLETPFDIPPEFHPGETAHIINVFEP